MAVMLVDELTAKPAFAVPNLTAVALSSPIPVMVTDDPPDASPASGLTLLTVGGLGRVSSVPSLP